MWKTILAIIGAAFLARKLISLTIVLLQSFYLDGIDIKTYKKGGDWAIITGASDGIGKEFAVQLAKAKYNVIILARTTSKLNDLAKQIERRYSVQTKVITFDFEKADPKAYEELLQSIKNLEIGILINNVGRAHEIPVTFTDTSDEELNAIININIIATMKMTKLILPKMLKRRKGLILTLGSFAGTYPNPLMATYSASKAFLTAWSQALAAEVHKDGILVQSITPLNVVSNMSKKKKAPSVPYASEFVTEALRSVGNQVGANAWGIMTPYWSHALLTWVLDNFVTMSFSWFKQNYLVTVKAREEAIQKLIDKSI